MDNLGKTVPEALGWLVIETGRLETIVSIVLNGLVGVNQRVGELALPDSMARRLSLIRELLALKVQTEELRETATVWTKEVGEAYQSRNSLIHRTWLGSPEDDRYLLVPRRIGGPMQIQTPDDINKVVSLMRSLQGERVSFIGDLVTHVGGTWAAGPSGPVD